MPILQNMCLSYKIRVHPVKYVPIPESSIFPWEFIYYVFSVEYWYIWRNLRVGNMCFFGSLRVCNYKNNFITVKGVN